MKAQMQAAPPAPLTWEEWQERTGRAHLQARIHTRRRLREARLHALHDSIRRLDPLWHLALVEKRVREEVAAEKRAREAAVRMFDWIPKVYATDGAEPKWTLIIEPARSSNGFNVWRRIQAAWHAFTK